MPWPRQLTSDEAAGFFGQRGSEIAFSCTAPDGDDEFPFVLWAFGDFHGDMNISARGNSDEEAFFFADAAGHGKSIVITHGDNLIDDIEVEIIRDKARSRALDFMGTWFDGLT